MARKQYSKKIYKVYFEHIPFIYNNIKDCAARYCKTVVVAVVVVADVAVDTTFHSSFGVEASFVVGEDT